MNIILAPNKILTVPANFILPKNSSLANDFCTLLHKA